jgi:hypothetical protein
MQVLNNRQKERALSTIEHTPINHFGYRLAYLQCLLRNSFAKFRMLRELIKEKKFKNLAKNWPVIGR